MDIVILLLLSILIILFAFSKKKDPELIKLLTSLENGQKNIEGLIKNDMKASRQEMANLVTTLGNTITNHINEMNNTIMKNISEMSMQQQNLMKNFHDTVSQCYQKDAQYRPEVK